MGFLLPTSCTGMYYTAMILSKVHVFFSNAFPGHSSITREDVVTSWGGDRWSLEDIRSAGTRVWGCFSSIPPIPCVRYRGICHAAPTYPMLLILTVNVQMGVLDHLVGVDLQSCEATEVQ